jgi:hypothetical protein
MPCSWEVCGIAEIIDEEKKVRHSKFSQRLEEVIIEPAKMSIKLKAEAVDISYPPIVQSGGVFDLKASATSDDRHLQYDVVLISIGALPARPCTCRPHSEGDVLLRIIQRALLWPIVCMAAVLMLRTAASAAWLALVCLLAFPGIAWSIMPSLSASCLS